MSFERAAIENVALAITFLCFGAFWRQTLGIVLIGGVAS